MKSFIKINSCGGAVYINPKHIISIEEEQNGWCTIHCTNDRSYNICVESSDPQEIDMTKDELNALLAQLSNTYMINESNSSIR